MNSMKPKEHILITGGDGFIGGYLASQLSSAGYVVTTVSRNEQKAKNHIKADLIDLRAAEEVAKLLSEVNIIIHCASIAHGEKTSHGIPVGKFNSTVSRNILRAFGAKRIKWIFMSSISVYGDEVSSVKTPFSLSPTPCDDYGRGKLQDEDLFLSQCDDVSILRLMPVYASGRLNNIKKRVYFPFLNIKIKLIPSPLYSICKVEEVAKSVEACLKLKNGRRVLQVGDSNPIAQSELTKWFSGVSLPLPSFLFSLFYFLIPGGLPFLKRIKYKIKKLGLNNIFEVGCWDILP